MGGWLRKWWDVVKTSFWFIPALMALGAFVVAWLVIQAEHAPWIRALTERGYLYSGGPEGARAMLTMIGGSMITIAGVVFSITIVVLSLASQQFGPRMIRSFMNDRGNQVTLGTFIATFLYCTLGLRVVDAAAEDPVVPHLAVSVGVVFALVNLAVLIYFIHHVASSIRVTHVITTIGYELDGAIDRLFPQKIGDPAKSDAPPRPEATHELEAPLFDDASAARPLLSPQSGYLQIIDGDNLLQWARRHEAVVRVDCTPGRYVIEGEALGVVVSQKLKGDDPLRGARKCFVFGSVRTPVQDLLFPVEQLSEIAIRAMSPGVNDPHTAAACADRLAAALVRLAGRSRPSSRRLDDEGRLRLVMQPVTVEQAVRAAFVGLINYARHDPGVLMHLLDLIARLGEQFREPSQRAALCDIAQMVREASNGVALESERSTLDERSASLIRRLSG